MDHAAIAVVLRAMKWNLDDAAFQAGRGDLGPTDCAQLATALEGTAASVRAYAGQQVPLFIHHRFSPEARLQN